MFPLQRCAKVSPSLTLDIDFTLCRMYFSGSHIRFRFDFSVSSPFFFFSFDRVTSGWFCRPFIKTEYAVIISTYCSCTTTMDMGLQMDVDIRLFATLYVTFSLAIPYLCYQKSRLSLLFPPTLIIITHCVPNPLPVIARATSWQSSMRMRDD
jgi:hypothetical protein